MKPNLNPTLWRTCRMLAGRKRVELLRQLHDLPGRNVTDLGQAVGIKRADASQELRRIQSRGLLKSKRCGLPLIYQMEADPQVSSAAPLLQAIQAALAATNPGQDARMCEIARGLAHERRIAILRILLTGPCTFADLSQQLHISPTSLADHLSVLLETNWISRKKDIIRWRPIRHPLAQTLLTLLRSAGTP